MKEINKHVISSSINYNFQELNYSILSISFTKVDSILTFKDRQWLHKQRHQMLITSFQLYRQVCSFNHNMLAQPCFTNKVLQMLPLLIALSPISPSIKIFLLCISKYTIYYPTLTRNVQHIH